MSPPLDRACVSAAVLDLLLVARFLACGVLVDVVLNRLARGPAVCVDVGLFRRRDERGCTLDALPTVIVSAKGRTCAICGWQDTH